MKSLFLCVLAASLCSLPLFGASGQHAPAQWIEIKSPHFTVLTDTREKQGRDLAIQFEQMRAIFSQLLVNGAEIQSPPVQIIAMEDQKRLIEYALLMDQDQPFAGNVLDSGNLITDADNGLPTGVDPGPESGLKTITKYAVKGVYLHNQDVDYALLNLKLLNLQASPLHRYRIGREIVLHEYAHRLLESNFPVLPRWFEEGFAVYFSTIKIQKDQLVMGVSPQTISGLSPDQYIPVATLFSSAYLAAHSGHTDSEESAFYAESPRIVDYLLTYHKIDQAQKYFQLIRSQIPVPEAIKQAFNMTPEEFDAEIKKLPEGPKMTLAGTSASTATVFTVPKVEGPITIAPVSELALETTLADFHLHEPGYHAKAVKEFEAILVRDPLNTGAQRGLGLDSLRHRNLKPVSVRPFKWILKTGSAITICPWFFSNAPTPTR